MEVVFQPFLQGGGVHAADVSGGGHRGGGSGGLAGDETARNYAQRGLDFTVATDAASCHQQVFDAERNQRTVRDAVTFAGFAAGFAQHTLDALLLFGVGGGGVDVDRVTEPADFIREYGAAAVVVAVELVFAADAAGFAHAEQGGGLHEVGMLETGDVPAVEVMVDFREFAPFDI